MNPSVLAMVKDIGLGLVQIGGLLLTINLAVISSTAQQTILDRIRGQIIWSSLLLALSILLGVIVLSMAIMLVSSTSSKLQKAAEWLSTGQAVCFFLGLLFLVWAVILRLS
jgi:hypothetical protein